MPLTRQEVQHVADLARLGLSETEIERFQAQLSDILDQFQALQKLDTEAIPPTAQVIALTNVMRPDESHPSFPRDVILANAPREEDGCFRVKAVLEE